MKEPGLQYRLCRRARPLPLPKVSVSQRASISSETMLWIIRPPVLSSAPLTDGVGHSCLAQANLSLSIEVLAFWPNQRPVIRFGWISLRLAYFFDPGVTGVCAFLSQKFLKHRLTAWWVIGTVAEG